jgi:hypothetical protein
MTGGGGARRRARAAAATAAVLVCTGAGACSCGGGGTGGEGHDSVPESRDVVVNAPARAGDQGYDYVARRPLAVVALAEARGLDPEVARAAVNHLADALDACATEEGRKGTLAAGAARLVAQIDGDGRVAGASLRVDPGAGVAQNAVVCLVAPAKMLLFPPADAGARGMAIEALWGSVPR